MLNSTLREKFGHQVRVRACGVLTEGDKILLLKHEGIGKKGVLWLPPGGAVEFGSSIEETLIKEFKEETGLTVAINDSLFTMEYIAPPLHAIEFFFHVRKTAGQPRLGMDPELDQDEQILTDVGFYDEQEIMDMGFEYLHHAFSQVKSPLKILSLKKHIVYREV